MTVCACPLALFPALTQSYVACSKMKGRPGNETMLGRDLGMRPQWAGAWERDHSGQGPGNEITVGRGLGTRPCWAGAWE